MATKEKGKVGRPQKRSQEVESLIDLVKEIKRQDIEPTFSYINYAPYPIYVLHKEFNPYGKTGHKRSDIVKSDIDIMIKSDLIKNGEMGEDSENPTDGSYSNSMIENICKLSFSDFCSKLDSIYGVITLERINRQLFKVENPSKFEKYCLNRISELSVTGYVSDHVSGNIKN
jgi:hypothetical protein